MRDEQCRKPFLGEWVDRVEGLGRRAGLELDELARLLEADQCVCQPVRGVAELGGGSIREELAFRREKQVDDRGGEWAEREQQATLEEPADAARLYDGAGEHRDGALDQHVAIANMGELVRKHALELGWRGGAEQAAA